jgi:hypothetical protein
MEQKFNIEQACCRQAHWITKWQFWENMKGWGHILWNLGTLLKSLHFCSLQCANRTRKIFVASRIYTTGLLVTVFSCSNRNVQGGSNMTGTYLCVNTPHKSRSYLNHLVLPSRLDSGITINRGASSILRRVTSLFIYGSFNNCTLLQMDYELGNV